MDEIGFRELIEELAIIGCLLEDDFECLASDHKICNEAPISDARKH
jgi:hypothetical protein